MGLAPETFWRMSLTEWRASVRGFQARRGARAAAPLARCELDDLMERYPDG
jgi:uncharacterized phage protein (TIGR02216 family)